MLRMSFQTAKRASTSLEDEALFYGIDTAFYNNAITDPDLLDPRQIKKEIPNSAKNRNAGRIKRTYSSTLKTLKEIVDTYIAEEQEKSKGQPDAETRISALLKQRKCIDSISNALLALSGGKSQYVEEGIAGHNDVSYYYIVDAWKSLEYHFGIGSGLGFEDLLEFHKERLSPELMARLRTFNEDTKNLVLLQSPNPKLEVQLYQTHDAKLAVKFIFSPESRAKFLDALGSAGQISHREPHNKNARCPEMHDDANDTLFIPGFMDNGAFIAQFPNKIMRDKFCAMLLLHVRQQNGVEKIDRAEGCHIRIANPELLIANENSRSLTNSHTMIFTEQSFNDLADFIKHRFEKYIKTHVIARAMRAQHNLFVSKDGKLTPYTDLASVLASITGTAAQLAYGLRIAATLTVTGAAFVGLQIMQYARNWYKSRAYRVFILKSTDEKASFEPAEVEAFDVGVEAAQSYRGLLFSFVSRKAYTNAKAYYAGYQATECRDAEMVVNVRSKLKVD